MERKLQFFISSTYQDLIFERERAIKVILKHGHIPAGMELFQPGNEPSKEVIKKWIDESDAYILILGYRYGSIDSQSDLSFTHWEYSYAVESKKRLFCVLINDDDVTKQNKILSSNYSLVIEQQHPQKYTEFRRQVASNHQCAFFSSLDELEMSLTSGILSLDKTIDEGGWYRLSSLKLSPTSLTDSPKIFDLHSLISNNRLTPNEMLLLAYARERQVYDFEYGIDVTDRLNSIKYWELENGIASNVRENYFSLIELLANRKIFDCNYYDSNGTPRSYYFNPDFYTCLVNTEEYESVFDRVKNNHNPFKININELPF